MRAKMLLIKQWKALKKWKRNKLKFLQEFYPQVKP
jgi:hypothetical protein